MIKIEDRDPETLTLEELKTLLKKKRDLRPRYLFNEVTNVPGARDYRYVFWLDLMGARNAMKLSLPRATRSIMKIHVSALEAVKAHKGVEINPVMDGVYGYSKDRTNIEACLRSILTSLAHVFVLERPVNRFMVRAGLAFGPLIPGKTLSAGSELLKENLKYLGGTAIGMAISHAFEAESCAPPFGVYIHESARAFAPVGEGGSPYSSNLWHWFEEEDAITWGLKRALLSHFEWVSQNPVASQYRQDDAQRHRALAVEYFDLHRIET